VTSLSYQQYPVTSLPAHHHTVTSLPLQQNIPVQQALVQTGETSALLSADEGLTDLVDYSKFI